MVDKDKMDALDKAVKMIEKEYGKNSIMFFGDKENSQIQAISTGILPLDIALGVGGLPRGRIIEIFGPESGGKTTLSLCCLAQAQKQGGLVAFVDAEHAMDPEYAAKLGIDVDKLLISQPDSGEEALEIVEKLVSSGAIDAIVIDSVAALVPKAEIEGAMGDSHMGLQARLMSQALRKLTSVVAKSKTTVIFINQIRQKIGVMWGNPETTPGGLALKFYSSVRLDIRRMESVGKVDDKEGVTANKVKVKVVKNKVAPPFRVAIFNIVFGKGVDRVDYLLTMGVDEKFIEREGNTYSFNKETIGVGLEKAKKFLEDNPLIADAVEVELKKKYLPQISKQQSGDINA